MSDAQSEDANQREVAYRLFAAEYDDADLSYSEGEEERAPNYVVTPTGARVNRTFFVGVLTEVEAVSEDVLRARVVDPTGAFVLYAGQYQPDEQAFLDGAETPSFVAVTGKARTFQPEDANRVYTSIRPETINEVDADTRNRWTVRTAERTLQRVGWMASAIGSDRRGGDLETGLVSDGVDEGFASGIVRAADHYGTSPAYLSAVAEMALDTARLVTGETDEADPVTVPPDAAGEADLDSLAGYADLATVHGRESTESGGTDQPGTESDSTGEPSGDATTAETTEAGAEVGDFEPAEFDLDDEEREEIEAEFGTEFQSGTQVDDPGEADIETPEPDGTAAQPSAGTDDSNAAAEDATSDSPVAEQPESSAVEEPESSAVEDVEEPADAPGTTTADTEDTVGEDAGTGTGAVEADDVDLEDATLDVMAELDDGAGAERQVVIETVSDRYSIDSDAVEGAIQDALMDGRCYEPDDATLKPI